MTKVFGSVVAIALLAAPALAELSRPGKTIPKGSYTVEPYFGDGELPQRGAGDIYDNLTFGPPTYSINNADKFVGDDLHMAGATVTSFRWVYTDGGLAASHSSSLAFFYNTAGDAGPLLGNTVTFVSGTMVYGAVFNVTGLPQATPLNPAGGWLITVTLPALVSGLDVWAGLKSTSTTPPIGPGNRRGLRGGGVITIGSSHNLHWSGFFTTPPTTVFFSEGGTRTGNFRWAVGGVPEPAVAALMVVGGLLVLRRRTRCGL